MSALYTFKSTAESMVSVGWTCSKCQKYQERISYVSESSYIQTRGPLHMKKAARNDYYNRTTNEATQKLNEKLSSLEIRKLYSGIRPNEFDCSCLNCGFKEAWSTRRPFLDSYLKIYSYLSFVFLIMLISAIFLVIGGDYKNAIILLSIILITAIPIALKFILFSKDLDEISKLPARSLPTIIPDKPKQPTSLSQDREKIRKQFDDYIKEKAERENKKVNIDISNSVKVNNEKKDNIENNTKNFSVILRTSSPDIKCPKCGQKQPNTSRSCSSCGLLFINKNINVPYWCFKCFREGPFDEKCPNCGCESKIFNN